MTGAAAMEIGGVTTASNSTTCETKPMLAGWDWLHKETRLNIIDEVSCWISHSLGWN
jgi:hypothetical protein